MPKESHENEWVSLREAANILGVHPATVRNWADRGDLPTRRTPGGHRRFRRGDLEQWVEASQSPPPAEVQMLIQSALGRVRLHIGEGQLQHSPWFQDMDEGGRVEMRRKGIELLELLQRYLADPAGTDTGLAAVADLGREYANLLIGRGLRLSQTMEGFLVFSDFLNEAALNIVEVVNVRTPSEWITLLRQVRKFNNALLLSMSEVYEQRHTQ